MSYDMNKSLQRSLEKVLEEYDIKKNLASIYFFSTEHMLVLYMLYTVAIYSNMLYTKYNTCIPPDL